jgi:hypothetical protein
MKKLRNIRVEFKIIDPALDAPITGAFSTEVDTVGAKSFRSVLNVYYDSVLRDWRAALSSKRSAS